VAKDFGGSNDLVVVRSIDRDVDQVRLTFTRSEVGNGNVNESSALPWHDGGLAVRMQAQDETGTAFGPVSRFEDEGISFRAQSAGVKLDIRDVAPDISIGLFDVAVIGTTGSDVYDLRRMREDYYAHGGGGDDNIIGGSGNDYLVGGFGNDVVKGGIGNDVLVGGPGSDHLIGGSGDDTAIYRHNLDAADTVDLGSGDDTVQVLGPPAEIRLTWSTLQTGNGNPNDSGSLPNEDGGLNIRLQAEDSAGNITGLVSRFDDEGISFVGVPGVTFDVRNLADGAQRGSGYGIARFGSSGNDVYDDSGAFVDVFHNGGDGDDRLTGGSGADHLVGLAGNDRLQGGAGDDLLVGLAGADTFVFSGDPGRDTILTYEVGTDRIDLTAYGITAAEVHATQVGANTIVGIDTNKDGMADFEIFLGGSAPPAASDYLF
jgi:Ca2+-binding RTX toxin-like protein